VHLLNICALHLSRVRQLHRSSAPRTSKRGFLAESRKTLVLARQERIETLVLARQERIASLTVAQ